MHCPFFARPIILTKINMTAANKSNEIIIDERFTNIKSTMITTIPFVESNELHEFLFYGNSCLLRKNIRYNLKTTLAGYCF